MQSVSKVKSESHSQQDATVPADAAGRRLDQVLVELFPDYSRNRLQEWIKAGQLTVNGRVSRARDKVWGGERVALVASEVTEVPWVGEAIPRDVV